MDNEAYFRIRCMVYVFALEGLCKVDDLMIDLGFGYMALGV